MSWHLILTCLLVCGDAFYNGAYAQRQSPHAMSLFDINDIDGTKKGELFLTSEEVSFGPNQELTSGAKSNTPANRRLEEFIKIVNSGDYDSIRAYVQASFTEEFIAGALDGRVDALMRLHDSSREFEIFRIMSSSKDRLIAEVSNRLAEMNQALGVSVERSSPHRITMWYTGPVSESRRPEGALPPTESQIIESMNGFLDRLSAAGCFSGSVLVAKNDSILLLRAVGLAHRDPAIENRTNTRFNIASVGKLFTTVSDRSAIAVKGKFASFFTIAGERISCCDCAYVRESGPSNLAFS